MDWPTPRGLFIVPETPSGTIGGGNVSFTLSTNYTSQGMLFLNGIKLISGKDYTRSGASITMVVVPQTGDTLEFYT